MSNYKGKSDTDSASKDKRNTNRRNNNKRKNSRCASQQRNSSARARGTTGKPEATENLVTQDIKANDPQWYMNGPSGPIPFTVPFSEPTGKLMDFAAETVNGNTTVNPFPDGAMPGIMSLEYIPTYGNMTANDDPINTSLTRLHVMLRYGQSYAHTYDAAHLGVHLIMADQLFTMITMLRRAYGLMRWYSSINKNMPELYVRALGFRHSSLGKEDMERFRQYINTLVRKCAMLKVPADWKLFKRHQFMCETIYMDTPTTKSQMYAFVPAFFYKYVVSSSSWKLSPVAWGVYNHDYDLQSLMAYCDEIVNSYVYDEDAVIISADILRIYGASGCYQLQEIDPNYTTQPMYDPTIIAQIHNATVLGPSFNAATVTASVDITQNSGHGCLYATPYLSVKGASVPSAIGTAYTKLLDAPADGVTPEYVAEATRLMYYPSVTPNAENVTFGLSIIGTEVITSALVWYRTANGGLSFTNPVSSGTVDGYAAWMKFDNAPMYWVSAGTFADGAINVTPKALIGNVNNYAYVTPRMLQVMHSNAQYSLFDIPVLDSAKITVGK